MTERVDRVDRVRTRRWRARGEGPVREHRRPPRTAKRRRGGRGEAAPEALPLIPLPRGVILPSMIVPLQVEEPRSLRAVAEAARHGGRLLLAPQLEAERPEGLPGAIFPLGVVAHLEQVVPLPGGAQRVAVRGLVRAELVELVHEEPYLCYRFVERPDPVERTEEIEGLMRQVLVVIEAVVNLMPGAPREILQYVRSIQEPGLLADNTAYSPDYTFEQRLEILKTFDVAERLRKVYGFLTKQLELMQLRARLQEEVKTSVDRSQREYILREQLKAIRKELGETDAEQALQEELRQKIEQAGMPEAVKERALRELRRLEQVGSHQAEASVIRTYLEWLTDLPWSKRTEDHIDLAEARRVLDEDHYGLEKVKERILEYMAVRKLAGERMRSPILCFVGPPGVGKTSLGRSIARAIGRQFVRVSLGGIRDEAEIRGHRRTYVGALPGRIIQGMRTAKSSNPVFMLDEIDKLGMDFRGDPSAALLEVLDPEQNREFSDHYLEVPFDLSQTIFITTANLLDPIPAPLRDRMEVIQLSGYTELEKVRIAQGFLVPRQREAHGLREDQIAIEEEALFALIREYTREAGVRNLEREIAALCRKTARRVAEGETEPTVIRAADLSGLLGPPRFSYDLAEEKDEVGVVTGVAYTETGGDILSIEVSLMEGKGTITLTGQLGQVMQESAQAALSYARAHAAAWGLSGKWFDEHNVHIHVPAGAVPKDGPSAGIAIATALISALTGRPVRKDVAMTGEITLRGKVLPIGGLKEKAMAAHRAGVTTFLLPKKNAKDLAELPEKVRQDIRFITVEHIDEVLPLALLPAPNGRGRTRRRPRPALPEGIGAGAPV